MIKPIQTCKTFFLVVVLSFSVMSLFAANRYSVATGNWNATSTWSATSGGASGASVPVAGDIVYIERGFNVTITSAAACATINFTATTATSLNINSGITLDVSGTITIPRPGTGNNLIAVGAGNLNAASIAFTSGGGTVRHQITISTGTVTVTGNVTTDNTGLSASITFTGTGFLKVGGSLLSTPTNGGTLTTVAGSTVEYNGAGNQTAKVVTYNGNLTLSGTGIKTFATTPTVNGILSMEGTATVTVTTGVVTYGANATLQYNTATARTASAEEWITPFAASGGVIIANTGGITLNEAKVFNASVPLTINSGASLATNNFQVTFGGNFVNGGTFTAGSSPIVIANTMGTQNIAGFTTTGTVSMTKTAGTATFTGNVNGGALTINGNGGTLNLGTNLIHTFTGTWTRTNGTLNGGSSLLKIGGNVSGTGGTFTAGTGTVEWYANGPQTCAGVTYNNLTLSGSGAKTITGSTINGILSMEGTATSNGTEPTYGANATIQYKGSAVQTTGIELPATFSGTGGVIINNAAGVTLSNSVTINSILTLTNGALAIGANSLVLGNAANLIYSTGSLTGGLTSNLTIGTGSDITLNAISGGLNNFNSSRNIILGASLSINGSLTLTNGTFTVGANTLTLNGPTIAGTPSNLSTTSSSNLVFGGTTSGVLIPTSVAALNDLSITNTSIVTLQSSPAVSGTFNPAGGGLSIGANTLTLNGQINCGTLVGGATSNITIGGSGTADLPAVTLNDLSINRVVSMCGSVTVGGTLSLTSGALSIGANTLTLSNGGNISYGGGSLTGGATSDLTIGTGADITLNDITGGLNNFNSSRNIILGTSLTVNGTLTLTAGAFTVGANTLTLNGPTIGGTPSNLSTSSSSSLVFGGTTPGVLIPTSVVALNDLSITNTSIVTLQSSPAVSGTFNPAGGGLSIGANTLTLNGQINCGTLVGGATSNITIGGSGTADLPAVTLNNLTIGRAVTMCGSVTVGGTLTLSSGTFTVGANTLTLNGPTIAGTSSNLITSAASSLILGGNSAGVSIPSSVTNLNNLTINNSNGVSLAAGLTVSNILTMNGGNITSGGSTLILSNSTSTNLAYTSGTIIGRFQRAIGSTLAEYLFPAGTATAYNPLKITFTNLTTGQLAVQFMANDIGVAGLPLNDAGTEIFDRQTTGYWSLTAIAPMASTNYSVNLNYSGFTGVDAFARIIRRNNGGNLILDGTHGSVVNPEITRTAMSGISTTSTDFAIGKPSLRITSQPADFSGCTATFSVTVSGKAPLSYQWQENNGGGYTNITNGGIYSGATSNTLLISGATGSMNGYQYRCIATDGLGYSATSSGATLSFVPPVSTFGYNYSMDVTLDPASGTADLTDFPALISFTSALLRTTANGGHISSSNGFDIIFTDLNGYKLDHQIEYYVETTGQYIAWVRIPLLSRSATTTIRMYYGNPTVSLNPSVKSVWTSSYKGVWHLNGTDYTDGTSYSNNGTNSNTTTVTGRIAGGRGFNGTTAYISVPTNGFVPNDNNQTISIWANYAATPGGNRNLISFQAGQSGSAIQLGFRGGNAVAWEWGGTILADGGAAPSINTWHYYVYTYDGTTSRIYIDGVLRGSSTVAPQTLLPTEGNIGRYNNGEYINASIDEPRFSMSPKSAGWIQTEYNNQNDPANFISLGSETNATLLAAVGICSTTYTLNQGFPSGGTYSGTGVSGTNFNASVAGVGTHSITYSYTDVNGCSASASKNIIVTAMPAVPTASDKQSCYLNIVDLEATGNNIKWYSDAGLTTLVGNGTPFATGRTTAGVYTYYATQTINGCESTATTVSLTILPGISIGTQPQPTSICTAGSGTFSVVASGSNLTYQWQENLSNITNGGVYSGATTATLTLTNPGIGLNGRSYRCVVSSSCGTSVNSTGAILTVTTLPVATFSYTGTPYCPNAANPLPTFSGGGVAGIFSSTAGLVFVSTATGQVNIAASTPGSYTVTNTIAAAGGCGIVIATSPLTITSTLVWIGGSTDWNTPGNWSCGLLPNINTSVQIPNVANKPVLSAGAVGIVKDLTIDAGSSLTISGNTIQISGAISNNGTFTASSGTVELNGSAAQSINANTFTGNTIRNLIINNAAGVSLGGTLNVSGILTAQSGTFSAANYLTLISDASGTALISGSGSGSVTGNVTMQRYLPSGFGYKYFSSPMQSATVNDFNDDMTLGPFTFYRFDENSASSGWVIYHTPATNPLTPLQGYAINFGSGSAPNTVDVTGAVNNGPLSVTLYNNNGTFTDGFNLVGNPYPSPINWNAASGWTKTNLDNSIYYFKASATDEYGGRYGSYNGIISSDGDSSSNIIPSMQGFFVRVTPGTFPVTGTLGMTNSVRVTDMTHPFLKSAMMFSTPLIRLTAGFSDDNESLDPTVIYFDEKASTGFDSQLDALKLYNTDFSIANLYTLGSDGSKFSINSLPLITDTLCTIPLGLKLNRDGNVVFKVKDIDPSLSVMKVYLTDIVTGSVQDLSAGNQYQINLGEGEYTGRFFLNLDNLSTQILSGTQAVELFTVYCTHGILKAEINTKPGERGTLYIYNLTGQVLFSEKIYEPGYHEFSPGIKDGIYIVTFVSGNKLSSKKIIIQN